MAVVINIKLTSLLRKQFPVIIMVCSGIRTVCLSWTQLSERTFQIHHPHHSPSDTLREENDS